MSQGGECYLVDVARREGAIPVFAYMEGYLDVD